MAPDDFRRILLNDCFIWNKNLMTAIRKKAGIHQRVIMQG